MFMACSIPNYCIDYDMDTNFKCIACRPGFRLAADHLSCICDSPSVIFNEMCGVFPPGCNVLEISPMGTLVCKNCDTSKKLKLNAFKEC